MQGTQAQLLGPTCRGATKPVSPNYWVHVPQLWEACTPQQSSPVPQLGPDIAMNKQTSKRSKSSTNQGNEQLLIPLQKICRYKVSVNLIKTKMQWKIKLRASLWLSGKVLLPMQETWVRSLIQDPTCCGATKPAHPNCCTCPRGPWNRTYWRVHPGASALQRERPPQREATHCT